MPSKTPAQHRAMEAAAHGHSTLGIPKKVGEEFVAKDVKGHAAGVLYVAPDGDVLLLRRSSSEENYPGYWALPGGKADEGETPEQAADREAIEEMGEAPAGTKKVLDRRITPTGMAFHTFAQPVAEKFAPKLNGEHSGYAWAPLNQLPQPVHPGVAATLQNRLHGDRAAADMTPEDWGSLVGNFLKWIGEEAAEGEHAEDDRTRTLASDALALDRSSVRFKDQDGHLHVSLTNISKANVCPYYGWEIPDYQRLGLDPDRVYQLLRDPEELAKAAPTFEGKPLLSEHKPQMAATHDDELVAGAIGNGVVFQAPYLKAPLVVWRAQDIARIESDQQKELSCGYRYDADMTPGTYQGVPYDGVMRNIRGNHVALVEEGRAGSDVVVGDSKRIITDMPKNVALSRKAAMAKGAVIAYLGPKMAADAKVDLTGVFKGVTAKNWAQSKPKIAADIAAAVKGKLAKDATLDDVNLLLDRLDNEENVDDPMPQGGDDLNDNSDMTGDAEEEEFRKKLEGVLTPEEIEALCAKRRAGKQTGDVDPAAATNAAADAEEGKMKDMVTKPAMDAAIAAAVKKATDDAIARQHAIREAEKAVRPFIGELAQAQDSAEAVYKLALDAAKVDLTGVPPAAYAAMVRMLPRPDAKPTAQGRDFAADAAAAGDFAKRFPGVAAVRVI